MDRRKAVIWRRRWRWMRFVLFPVVVVGLYLLGRHLGLDGGDLESLRDWMGRTGHWGILVYVAAYILAAMAGIPGLPFTMLAGALYGALFGTVLAAGASWLAAGAAFLIARYLARASVSRWLKRREAFRRMELATEKRGSLAVFLSRLFPVIPFALLNFGWGLSRVPFGTYMIWTFIGMLPGTVFYVVGGDALAQGLSKGTVSWGHVIALLAVLGLLAALFPWARRHFRALKDDSGS